MGQTLETTMLLDNHERMSWEGWMMTNWAPRRGTERDLERRARQIKEMVRLGSALRAEMGLASIFSQVVEAINTTIGFNVAALNIVREHSDYVAVVATAGLDGVDREQLIRNPPRLERLLAAMRPEFCISHSYFISHHHKALLDTISGITLPAPAGMPNTPDTWRPDDMLLVPLISPRDERLLGVLSLDQPEDGKIPSVETIEIIELFANQAALAIDTSRLFQEREQERQTLRDGLFDLLFQLEQIRQGNLGVRPQLNGNDLLDPITQSLNATLVTLNSVLTEVRGAADMVNLNATEMRAAAARLAESADQQAEQMMGVSQSMETMAGSVRWIAETANASSAAAQETSEISHEGRDAAGRAAEGMSRVREMTLQAAKKVKRLGESSQEIGAIVQMVADFTNQTNLLALNAAIEAARAGEHGRGFAIVAQEIRNLATGSAEATRQIHARIQSVQNETSQVVAQIEHTTQQVVLQSEFAAQAGAALEAVDAATQRIAEAIDQMRVIATQQAQTATLLAQAVTDLAGGAIQTRDSMDQTRASMDYLVELANSLLRKVSMFHLGAEAPAAPLLLSPGVYGMAPGAMPGTAPGAPIRQRPPQAPGAMQPAQAMPPELDPEARSGPFAPARTPTPPSAASLAPNMSGAAPSMPSMPSMPSASGQSSGRLRPLRSNSPTPNPSGAFAPPSRMGAPNAPMPGAPYRTPTGPLRSGAFPPPNLGDVNGPPTGWLAPLPGQVADGPEAGKNAPAPVEITSVVPIVGVVGVDPEAARRDDDATMEAPAPMTPGFGQPTGYPTPDPLATFEAASPSPVDPVDPSTGAIEVGPGSAAPADDSANTPATEAAPPSAPSAMPTAEPVPDSGMIKSAAGQVNLEALAELTTLDEIELLETQPMPSVGQPGGAHSATSTQATLDANGVGAANAAYAPDGGDAANGAGDAAFAAPVTAEVMAFPPAHEALLHGLPYDTTPLPQMTTPMPLADLEASLRGAPGATAISAESAEDGQATAEDAQHEE